MIKTIMVTLMASAVMMCGISNADAKTEKREARDIIGSCHINSFYNFTDKDYMNEGADKLLELGTRVIKVVISENLSGYYTFNSKWPKITSLQQAAALPYFKELFDKPFKTYVLMTFTPGKKILYFTEGMTPEDVKREQDAFYEFTKYLLTTYKNTGKTFILQNWEGDWSLSPSAENRKDPGPVAIKGMIEWLNARQDGVDRARKEVGMHGVTVAHAGEVNLVDDAMKGKPTVTNSVLPYTHCDLYAYSAYDTITQGKEKFRKALDYIAAKAPKSKMYGEKNVYIGEFGYPENVVGEDARLKIAKDTVEVVLSWGAKYACFWELYDDGPRKKYEGRPTNDDMVGNWLIRPDGTKSKIWDYFQELFKSKKKY
ncbi:MAG: hypothetical protein ACYC27_13680 [Armatimonadota bacterium]